MLALCCGACKLKKLLEHKIKRCCGTDSCDVASSPADAKLKLGEQTSGRIAGDEEISEKWVKERRKP